MTKIRKIASLWISLSYRELIQTLVPRHTHIAFLILLILHLHLVLSFVMPGTSWGMYGCSTTIMAVLWNALLDRTWDAHWQQRFFQTERRASTMRPNNFGERLTKFFSQHLRLWFLAGIIILLAVPLFFS